MIVSLVSLGSFIALSGLSREGFSISYFGVIGSFLAIVVSVTSSKLFIKLCSVRFFQARALTDGANSAFNYAMSSIYPASITICVFAILNLVITSFFGTPDIQSLISGFLQGVFLKLGSSLGSAVLFIFLIHTFWFLGMHGSNILEPVAQNIFANALSVNINLINNNHAPTEIFTKTFFDTFVLMGGCGSTLCLICALFISAKHKNLRRHAKMSILPVLFNVNELIIFGIPIVQNLVYVIPFILIPVILTLVSYFATYCGLVPYTSTLVEWTTPIFLSGYTATNSIRGSLLQLFNLIIGTLCYIPFVKIAERKIAVQTSNNLKKVYTKLSEYEEQGIVPSLTTRHDDIGNTSRLLAADLKDSLENSRLALFYQPQVDFEGGIFGVEALLRWKHDIYGYIYPPLIIALAHEAQITDKLGYWIIDTACRDLKELNDQGLKHVIFSVNISVHQLENDNFINDIVEIIERYEIDPDSLEFEITEQIALTGTKKIINQLKTIKNLGIRLAMDDFGMGHSSLMYLKEYEFDSIKIDGGLVRDIMTNSTCSDIISSIVYLSKSLYFSIVAEYVETEEQKYKLHRLGCDQYQGYLYSPAVPRNSLIDFIKCKTTLSTDEAAG
jgi:lactose/cellobiose-specific phosphotransferase system IIC component